MDTNASEPIAGAAPLSTTLDTNPAAGPVGQGAAPLTEKQPEKPESVGDTLRSELSRVREEEAKEQAKAEADKAAKPEDDGKAKPEEGKQGKPDKVRAEDGKFAKKDEEPADKADKGEPAKVAAERSAPEDNRQSEGRKYAEPPARFLPEARTKWANVPNEVKAEVHRINEEVEREIGAYKQSHEAYEAVREFDEMAKKANTTLRTALEQYTGIENLLRSNPAAGLARILHNIGLTPQQYAEHVIKNPQVHQVQPASRPAPQQGPAPEVRELQEQIQEMKTQMASASVKPVIETFAASHPDYHSLEPKIVEILRSGVIENLYGTGLSPEQKLSEAYRMAGGSSPSRSEPEAAPAPAGASPARPVDPDGQRSIRGAPSGGHDPQDDVPETDIKALLRKELRKVV